MSQPTLNPAALSKVVSLLERAGERDLAQMLRAHSDAKASGAGAEELVKIWLTR